MRGGAGHDATPASSQTTTRPTQSSTRRWLRQAKNSGDCPWAKNTAEQIKSDIGDIKNTGGRWGGASTAAEFLKVFAEDTPWIHLDIAGMAWVEERKPYIAKGPSGVAVRSILEWVRSYAG